MKYSSVPEYFYKLHTRLYALVLVPLLTLVIVYWLAQNGGGIAQQYFSELPIQDFVAPFIALVAIDWLVALVVFRRKLKQILTLDSLGERLERYAALTFVRFVIVTAGLMILVGAFYLTDSYHLIILFAANLLSLVFFWPTSAKVCTDLKLKGDEQKLVFYKMDKLH